MEQLSIDFRDRFRRRKRLIAFQIIIGIFFVLDGTALAAGGLKSGTRFGFYDGFLLIAVGLMHLAFVIVSAKVKWHLKIDDQGIEYRPRFRGGIKIDWRDVANVVIGTGKARVIQANGKTALLNLNSFSYQDHQAIKHALEDAAREFGKRS